MCVHMYVCISIQMWGWARELRKYIYSENSRKRNEILALSELSHLIFTELFLQTLQTLMKQNCLLKILLDFPQKTSACFILKKEATQIKKTFPKDADIEVSMERWHSKAEKRKVNIFFHYSRLCIIAGISDF